MKAKRFALLATRGDCHSEIAPWLQACAALPLQPLVVDSQNPIPSDIREHQVQIVFCDAHVLSDLNSRNSIFRSLDLRLSKENRPLVAVILANNEDICFLKNVQSGWPYIISLQKDIPSVVSLINSMLDSAS
jgi:hypothetical protein